MAGAWERARRTAAGVGRSGVRAGRGTMRVGRTAARTTGRVGRGVGQATRKLTYAQGAGRTGLGRLIELTAAHSAGDALITVALAGTLFFGLPVDQARGQVALYLLITMAPFTVVAPFVGPVLDRFRSGRRYVMAGTLFARGLLCWAMAAAIGPKDTFTLFPAALAVLVLSKAYNVSRAAIMPSVLPADISLVPANARVSLFALVAAGVAAPLSAGLTAWIGAEWVLRGTMVVFLAAGVAAVRLPRHVDSPDLELDTEFNAEFDAEQEPVASPAQNVDPASDTQPTPVLDAEWRPGPGPASSPDRALTAITSGANYGDGEDAAEYGSDEEYGSAGEPAGSSRAVAGGGGRRERLRTLLHMGAVVNEAMYANAATRVQSGFLIFYLIFLVQDGNLPGLPTQATIAVLAASAGAGGLLGSAVASWIGSRSPQLIVLASLALATVTTIVTAIFFTLWSAVVVAAMAAFVQSLGKLALDAIVQSEIREEVRSSTFGVVEALLQIAWVAGGLAGLLLSLFAQGPAGLGVVAAGLALTLGWVVVRRRRRLAAAKATKIAASKAKSARSATRAAQPTPTDHTKPLTNPHG